MESRDCSNGSAVLVQLFDEQVEALVQYLGILERYIRGTQ